RAAGGRVGGQAGATEAAVGELRRRRALRRGSFSRALGERSVPAHERLAVRSRRSFTDSGGSGKSGPRWRGPGTQRAPGLNGILRGMTKLELPPALDEPCQLRMVHGYAIS